MPDMTMLKMKKCNIRPFSAFGWVCLVMVLHPVLKILFYYNVFGITFSHNNIFHTFDVHNMLTGTVLTDTTFYSNMLV